MPWTLTATLQGPPFAGDTQEITQVPDAVTGDSDDAVFVNRDGALEQIPGDIFRSGARQKWGQSGTFFQHAEDFEGWDGTTPAGNVDGTRLPADNVWQYRIGGTGAQIVQQQLTYLIPGVVRCSTGTTTTGRCALDAVFPQLAGFNSTRHRESGFTFLIPTLSDGTNSFTILAGLTSDPQTGAPVTFMGFALPAGTANWQCRLRAASVNVDIDSGVVAETTAFHTFYLIWDEVAGVMRWYIDGVQVAASATGKPAENTLCVDAVGIFKSAGTASRSIDVDKGYTFCTSAAVFKMP